MSEEKISTTEITLREYLEYRLDATDKKIESLSRGLDGLAGALINREVFDELHGDVKELENKNESNKERIRTLETKVAFFQWILTAVWLVLGPLVIEKIQELF